MDVRLAVESLAAGIRAAHPRRAIADAVTLDGDHLRVGDVSVDLADVNRVLVLGGGNAAGTIGVALEAVLGDRIDDGLVVTDDPRETDRVSVREGDHPLPTVRNERATGDLLDRARAAGPDDLVLAPITGGGSALLCAPAGDLSVDDLAATTDALLAAGVSIDRINAIRRRCSKIKGGGLASALAPARTIGVLVSDVVGESSVIASGPLSPDPGVDPSIPDGVDLPQVVRKHLADGGTVGPATDRAGLDRVVIADGERAIEAAATRVREAGVEPTVLSTTIRGGAADAARTQVAIAEEIAATGRPVDPPAVLLSGGETTVDVTGAGRGGPNTTFATAAALAAADGPRMAVASVDTDGQDGSAGAAGGVVTETTVDDPDWARAALRDDDTASYLRERGVLLDSGRTGTNVNDLRAVVVLDRD
ncbi:glycerate kinase type-2 family protein [Halococcoides cellulosivorans]|uniref:Glycerate kinase n=1 Tax=Halococcoides cellulosivorans TaxID=1679096 RepID=A0A2R4X4S7_9EURY|nr:glycerate kinase [Halococcoides cellulosivorans]